MSLQNPAVAYQLEDGEVVVLPELTVDLPGGLTGYYQPDFDSCLTYSLATLLQVDPSEIEVDDARIHQTMIEFAASRGLGLQAHSAEEPPDHLWMAVSERLAGAGDNKHAYLMQGSEVFFNPFNFRRPNGEPYAPGPLKAEFGYSLHERTP